MAVPSTEGDERADGFTLIELFVVVAVIGILVAIGIPLLLGSQTRAKDTAARDLVTTAFKAQKVHYTDAQAYTAVPTELTAVEPTLDEPLVLGRVIIKDATNSAVTLVSKSASGKCFWIREVDGRAQYSSSAPTGSDPCELADVNSLTWATTW